ncbi:MAG: DUF255 domain-containing protein [Thermofilaceae archaeon]|nr:DUF255 domain-containing protein [Thermofilaceae archaeon]
MVKRWTLVALVVFLTAYTSAEPINWLSYGDALREAREKGKPVYVYFYSDTCPYCLLMEDVFKEPGVGEVVNKHFLPVRVDVRERPDLSSLYRVPGTPAHLFLCSNGTPVGGVPGYLNRENFLDVLKTALDKIQSRCPEPRGDDNGTASQSSPAKQLGVEALTFSFLLGLATPLSPCLLPLLPVIYYVVSRGGGRRVKLFTLGLFLSYATLSLLAGGLLLALRIFIEPLAYILLLLAGVALLVEKLNSLLSQLASLAATKLARKGTSDSPLLLGVIAPVIWGPCLAPMAGGVFALLAFVEDPILTVLFSIAYAGGLTTMVYVLLLAARKVRNMAARARQLKKLNKVLGVAMILFALLFFAGLI